MTYMWTEESLIRGILKSSNQTCGLKVADDEDAFAYVMSPQRYKKLLNSETLYAVLSKPVGKET